MQFKPFEAGIEVSGECIGSMVDGFKKYPTVALKYMSKHGLVKPTGPNAGEVDRSAWFPLESWLAAYEAISGEIGLNSLYACGRSIPENAVFPPNVTDVVSAISSIEVAYHMNHRKGGVVMFNPETGKFLEGIGHYRVEALPEEHRIVVQCENPYPCDFDRGIVAAMANRFEPEAKTVHDMDRPCRKKGADSCTYVVFW
jgi:hypothetical protein